MNVQIPTGPSFSIVIPSYARHKQLSECLESLTQLKYPRINFEVIIVDDGSPLPPRDVLEKFRDRLDITLLTPSHSGPAGARNTGAAHAKGDVLAFTDDDCCPDPNWLQVLASELVKTPQCLVGGQTINALTNNLFSTASQVLVDYLYTHFNRDHDNAQFLTSSNMALSKQLFLDLNGFDLTFPLAAAEDREFSDRWLYHGYSIRYVPEAIVYHKHGLTFRSFLRQQSNYGRGAYYYHKRRFARGAPRINLERSGFYINLLSYRSPQGEHMPQALIGSLLMLSQFANVAGYFMEAIKAQLSGRARK